MNLRRWLFEQAERIPGFRVGFIKVSKGSWWLYTILYGPRVQFFSKRPKPDIYNPRRWGGALLGLEIGSRG